MACYHDACGTLAAVAVVWDAWDRRRVSLMVAIQWRRSPFSLSCACLVCAMALQTLAWSAHAMMRMSAWLDVVNVHDGIQAVHGVAHFP